MNTQITIKVEDDATRGVIVQLLTIERGAPMPVTLKSVRLKAGDEYPFEICPGVSLCIQDAEPAQ